MNAFNTSGPSTLFTKRELVDKQKPLRHNTPGTRYFTPDIGRFCTAIPSRQAQDRTNSIKGGK